jgi:hypothetical protein
MKEITIDSDTEDKSNIELSERPSLRIVHLDKVRDFVGFALETGTEGKW